jgi:hypothetical protein
MGCYRKHPHYGRGRGGPSRQGRGRCLAQRAGTEGLLAATRRTRPPSQPRTRQVAMMTPARILCPAGGPRARAVTNAPPTPPQLPLALSSVPRSTASGRRAWGVGPPLYHGVRAVVRPCRHPRADDRQRRAAAARQARLRNKLPTRTQPPHEGEGGRQQWFDDGS